MKGFLALTLAMLIAAFITTTLVGFAAYVRSTYDIFFQISNSAIELKIAAVVFMIVHFWIMYRLHKKIVKLKFFSKRAGSDQKK